MKQEDIAHLATLARIRLSDDEAVALAGSITDILGYVSEIDAITPTEKTKAVSGVYNVMREDEPTHEPGQYTEALLEAAPGRKDRYVEVRKILGESS